MRRVNFHLAVRQLLKTRSFTLLNILGLTLGLATFLLIVLYVVDEWSYDKFNANASRIYRVNTDLRLNQRISYLADAAPPIGATLLLHYPQIQQVVRIEPQPGTRFRKGSTLIAEPRVAVCDPSLFAVFTLPMVEGSPATALQAPHTVVITESAARRYFGSTHVIGRTLDDIDDTATLTVTGIIRDMPAQASFHYDFLISIHGNSMESNNSFYALFPMSTFILLRPGADPAALQRQLTSFMYRFATDYSQYDTANYSVNLRMMPLTDIHLRSNRTDELEPNGNIQYIYIFSAIAFFVLLIAAINFMNLSTARSANRAREVGVRKVLGSARFQLIGQFLAESFLMTTAAAVLALLLTLLVLPFFNRLAGKTLSFDGSTLAWLLPAALPVVLATSLLAGAYPAFFLSAFRPVQVLKGRLATGFKGGALRNTLVVFQFSISLFLIVGTGMIGRQLHYIQGKDLGFDRSHVLTIKGTSSVANPLTLKTAVLQVPDVASATLSGFLPTNDHRWHNFGSVQGLSTIAIETQSWLVDADYIPTLEMQMLQGRNFSSRFGTDSTALVINESAARLYGIAGNPLNRIIHLTGYEHGQTALHVIGVVKDFNFASLRDNITPLVLIINKLEVPDQLTIRVKSDNLPGVMKQLKSAWARVAPHQPFEYSFLDADFDALYHSEQRLGQLSLLFAALVILIACIGLFGLAAYAAEQRTKEIGIRKVLGANVAGIVTLLSTDFLRLIAVSILIAIPLAWLGMHQWLQNFAYRASITPWLFILGAAVILFIAIATTIVQSIRAALTNPVTSLRSE
jgi:putative ABC transport system permease protein